MMVLPVTVGGIVAVHVLETGPIDASDEDLDAGPSVAGEAAGTWTALGSARCVAAIGTGVTRGLIVARGRRRWSHYGITGITARVT